MNHVSPLLLISLLALAAANTQATPPASKTLSSGVIAQTLTKGADPLPKASGTVRVHYHGTLTSGTKFDSFYKRGQPISFPLNRVILCWIRGVQKMQVGGKVRLMYPAANAYGERGVPGIIPPNSTLNFEVELLGIGG